MKKNERSLAVARMLLVLILPLAYMACNKTLPGDDDLGIYNINVRLHSTDMKSLNKSAGFIKFRQDPDTARIITLDTWIGGLEPNHDYLLRRAVNPITDNDCTSTAWLTLGKGLVPQAIHTGAGGIGEEVLFRDITAVARGTEFRIHFQIVDAVTLASVLESDCEQYTVR